MKRILFKSLIVLLLVVLAISVTALLIREVNQHKHAKKLVLEGPNTIEEQKYVEIGGIDQWITIRGEDRTNPILLTVPGGPGSTHTVFNPLLREWEKHFTVVQWDLRGSGKTFRVNGQEGSGSITFDILAQDGIELSEYLSRYLGQEKIILVGSSVGSVIALKMAKHSPELFHAYVGTDQNVGADPQSISYNLTLQALQTAGDTKSLEKVESMGPDKSRWSREQFDAMNKIMARSMPGVPDMIMDLKVPYMFYSPDHSISDIVDIFKGMNFSLDMLFDELIAFNAYDLGLEFELPFFIFHGDSDIITPIVLAEEYFDQVEAPHKEFAYIRDAGHLAAFARPEQFLDELVQRVLPIIQ